MILDEILAKRAVQLEREKAEIPPEIMRKMAEACKRPAVSLEKALRGPRLSVIAEIKRASPSKGLICPEFRPPEIAMDYEASGADAISCLTEEFYFQGSAESFRQARVCVSLPMLRKDFIVDPYQLWHARIMGADAVLLICAALSPETLRTLLALARDLQMEALVETHTEREAEQAVKAGGKIIGVNNRDLRTFEVDLAVTERIAGQLPSDAAIVSESGISSREDMERVRSAGAHGVLIGESLMRRPGFAAQTLAALREGV